MNKVPRIAAILGLGLLSLIILASIFSGWGYHGFGWGMMGPGMMGWGFGPLGWIVLPLLWLGAVVLVLLGTMGTIWFARALLRGTDNPKSCPACGCEALAGADYCWHCGKPLPK